jgi:hypothetical protein
VVRVHDFNCEDNGLVWMRLELLQGDTLAGLLARLGRLSPVFALSAGVEAADALHAAHEAGVIHRDVKPANLMYVTATRSLKVIDFSIARFFAEGLQTTAGRAGMGTPAFMPPEQMDGAPAGPGMDVYALGTSLWQLLAGRHPFEDVLNQSRALARRQYAEMPPLLADVAGLHPEIDEVIRKAVAKDPAKRYGTMRAMSRALAELRSFLVHEARAQRIVLVVPPGEPPPPGDARSRREHAPPQAPPPAEEAPPTPPARVVVPGSAMLVSATKGGPEVVRGFGGTLPLAALGGTAPLGAERPMRPPIRGGTIPLGAERPMPRKGELTARSARPAHRRVPWGTAGVAAAVLSLVSLGVVGLLRRQPPVKHDPAPAQTTIAALPPAPSPSFTPPPPPIADTALPVVAPPASAASAPRVPARAPIAVRAPVAAPPAPTPSPAPAPAPRPSSRRLFGAEE